MLRNKLSYSQIYNIVQSIKDSFDVRWLTAGKPYTILSSKDSLANPQYFIYQPNRLNYVVIDFSNFDCLYFPFLRSIIELFKSLIGLANLKLKFVPIIMNIKIKLVERII